MGFDERRTRKLTPMSGEHRAHEAWSDPKPRRRRRKERLAPSSRRGVAIGGLKRLAIALLLLSAIPVAAALVLVWAGDIPAARAFPLSFYLGGALIAGGGFLGAITGPSAAWMPEGGYDYSDHQASLNVGVVYGFCGVLLIAVGAFLESRL